MADNGADVIRDALALYRAALSDSDVSDDEISLLLENLAAPMETREILLGWAFRMLAEVLQGPGEAAGFLARTAECYSPVDVREGIAEWQYDFERFIAEKSP